MNGSNDDYEEEEFSSGYSPSQWYAPLAQPKHRQLGICIIWYILTLGIYQWYWLYSMHQELPSQDQDRSPGRVLVHLLLIPVALVFVGFVFMGISAATMNMAGEMSGRSMALIMVALLPIIGAAIYWLVWMIIIYSRLTERLNQLSGEQLGNPEPVNKTFAILAIVLPVIPYIGQLVAFGLWIAWWVSAQETANNLIEMGGVDNLAEVFE